MFKLTHQSGLIKKVITAAKMKDANPQTGLQGPCLPSVQVLCGEGVRCNIHLYECSFACAPTQVSFSMSQVAKRSKNQRPLLFLLSFCINPITQSITVWRGPLFIQHAHTVLHCIRSFSMRTPFYIAAFIAASSAL
jgi:hypothetical protein